MGIDPGASSVKVVVMDYGGGEGEILFRHVERIRRRDPAKVVQECYQRALEACGLGEDQIDYLASTGDGDLVPFRRGHFYGMTTHARGAKYFSSEVKSVLDVGALHARAMRVDERSRVLQYQMTGQCASGSGQFLENIARYLGVGLEEVGPLSLRAKKPEVVSTICAVLAETDVINMVSRGIATEDILKGIHLSIANRLAKLLRYIKADSPLVVTGGLAKDAGLMQAIREKMAEEGQQIQILTHPDSILAGAIGAALWAGFRHEQLVPFQLNAPNLGEVPHGAGA
ncbi:MAG: benzoyl-CoA reductase subunit D [Acidobacteria bacterium]|nr:benzoyl-CoA reductase subunit D [Acidobacteriota bacterium]